MDNEKVKKLKRYLLLFSLPFIIIIVYVIVLFSTRIGKIPVTIKYAPFISTVFVNGEKYANRAEHYLSPGTYSIKVVLDGFSTIEETVTVSEDTEYLFGALSPNSEEGEKLTEKYSNDFNEIERITSYLSQKYGQIEREEKPVLNYLPFKNSLFTIGHTYDQDDNLIITIRSSKTYLSSAIEKLKSFDSVENLSKYDIQIVDFDNEFNEFVNNSESNPKDFLKSGLSSSEDFSIQDGEYFNDEYYYTNVVTGSEDSYSILPYKVLLQKQNNSWKLIGVPYPFLTIFNTDKNVPIEALVKANNY